MYKKGLLNLYDTSIVNFIRIPILVCIVIATTMYKSLVTLNDHYCFFLISIIGNPRA